MSVSVPVIEVYGINALIFIFISPSIYYRRDMGIVYVLSITSESVTCCLLLHILFYLHIVGPDYFKNSILYQTLLFATKCAILRYEKRTKI